jgi:ParB-like chromosome segregation protein Spo0J
LSVGTLNRQNSFDAAFNPLNENTAHRWMRVRDAYLNSQTLAPVELHKIGDLYFVEDGHHRISVARFIGQETIEAIVIEYSDELAHVDC